MPWPPNNRFGAHEHTAEMQTSRFIRSFEIFNRAKQRLVGGTSRPPASVNTQKKSFLFGEQKKRQGSTPHGRNVVKTSRLIKNKQQEKTKRQGNTPPGRIVFAHVCVHMHTNVCILYNKWL